MSVSPERRTHHVDADEETLLLLGKDTIVRRSVRTAAHELNNAMQMISGSAEMLAAVPDLPARAQARVQTILTHLARCQHVVQSLSELAGHDERVDHPVNVVKAVDHALEMRRYEHTRAGVSITRTVPSGDAQPAVRFGAHQLERVLLALLLNAEDAVAGRPERAIEMTVAHDPQSVTISVRDSGRGLDPETDPFVPFGSSRPPAAGLGLFGVRVLVERYGGTLSLEALDPGTIAVVTLPRVS